MPTRAKFWAQRPYNALRLLPPVADLETKPILKALVGARAALAELKQAGELIPNQAILINTLPVLEARASSAIENIVTTADRLFRFAHDDHSERADPATKEALRYQSALMQGLRVLAKKPVTTTMAVEICRTLRGIAVDIRKTPGTALTDQATGKVVYTPPEGEDRLRDLLGNWERFLHEASELDPLIRMAVGHYQFEAIHPFTDGNGRTGRILNLLFLVEQELLDQPVLYLSRAIIRRRTDYYRLLNAVTTGDAWEPWVLFMLDAVHNTASWTTAKIRAIRELLRRASTHVREQAPSLYSRELVELMFEQPYSRIGNLVDAGIAKRQTASVYLKTLCDMGVLREVKAGREKLFLHPNLMTLLTADDHRVPQYRG
jgi:cell filamentation protein, protein adenylyltransferase